MQKNVSGQKWVVFAFDTTDLSAKTGDAANITANLRIDGGAANAVDDTNPTELEDGYYIFDISQAETNGNYILICPQSSTGDIQVIGCPAAVWTTPPNFSALGIESDGDVTKVNTLDGHTPQTQDHTSAIAAAQSDLDTITGSDGVTLATTQGNYAPAKAGDAMGISDDAITSAKFDESTAFPLASADSGSTQVARVGADGDTLETISDQLDAVGTVGPGNYEVTLTIRTTGGTAVSGVGVWLNTSNDRSVAVAGTRYTNANGQVTFNLEYTTYYIFCNLSGYTFANSSFTAAAGSVTFTKDIATAVSTGSSSFYDESFLNRAITDVREAIDEPTTDAKYTDARLVELLEKSYILVLNEINRTNQTPAVVRQEITVASDTTEYFLPYNLGSVYAIYTEGTDGSRVFYHSRSRRNFQGQAVWVEGKTLRLQSAEALAIGTTLIVEWIPSGVARLHQGTCTISSDGKTVTMGATPETGTLDTHRNGYGGGLLRILGVDGTTVTGNYIQERNITDHDETTRELTLDVALSPVPTTDDGNIYYEIAPAVCKGMDTVVALYTAYRIAITEGNQKRAKGILDAYRNEMRNVRLTSYYTNMTEAPRMKSDGFDNRRHLRH